MQAMKARNLLSSQRIMNMFGAVGYSLLIINCAIVAGAVLLWLINSGYGNTIGLQPEAPAEAYGSVGDTAPSGVLSVVLDIIAYMIAIVMGLAVIFVSITLPYWLGRVGSYCIKRIANLFIEVLTPAMLLLVKVIANGLIAVPILVIVAADIKNIPVLLFVSGLVLVTLVMFLLQHYLAKMNNLDTKDIW